MGKSLLLIQIYRWVGRWGNSGGGVGGWVGKVSKAKKKRNWVWGREKIKLQKKLRSGLRKVQRKKSQPGMAQG